MKELIFCYSLLAAALVSAQSPKRILLENATVHTGTGQVFDKGLIGITGTDITLVRNALAYTYDRSAWDTVIDLNGQHLYPGFMAPNSTLGLTEIDAVRATRDFEEVGTFNPHVRTLIAYNCESDVLSTVRTNGVLLAQSTPRSGVISGTSSILFTSCWNWEDGAILKDDGIHLNWPPVLHGDWKTEEGAKKSSDHYSEKKREITAFFDAAKSYAGNAHAAADLRFDALRDCFKGEKRLYIHANELQQLLDVLDFVKKYEIAYPVIVGGYDSYKITDRLKNASIPVMLPRLHALPEHDDDPVDLVYRLPALLQEGGVQFCLQNEGDMEAMNARNIPFLAGTAMSYGLPEEEAIRAVSFNACRIVGIGKYYGSIEEGKRATLFASSGNALDMRTNNITLILMNGQFVPVSNFQTNLYLKYKKKYGL